jgi:hypothetical protein
MNSDPRPVADFEPIRLLPIVRELDGDFPSFAPKSRLDRSRSELNRRLGEDLRWGRWLRRRVLHGFEHRAQPFLKRLGNASDCSVGNSVELITRRPDAMTLGLPQQRKVIGVRRSPRTP